MRSRRDNISGVCKAHKVCYKFVINKLFPCTAGEVFAIFHIALQGPSHFRSPPENPALEKEPVKGNHPSDRYVNRVFKTNLHQLRLSVSVFSNPRMTLKEEERQEGDRTPFRRFGKAV